MLSVVVPSYLEEAVILLTAETLRAVLSEAEIEYELLFVDDGSTDGTWNQILEAKRRDDRVRGIRFSRNFGKEAAIAAGLSEAKGNCCVVIDCDLQHPPETIVEMYRLWEQGYEVIEGRKNVRGKERRFYTFAAGRFNKMISRVCGIDMRNTSDFKLLDRKAVDALLQMPERKMFFRALSAWVGFRTTAVTFDVRDRAAGSSKWNVRKLTHYAIDNVASFSAMPMHAILTLGCLLFLISIVFGIVLLIRRLCGNPADTLRILVFLIQFFGSLILVSIGILGYYLARVFDEVKGRPRYIIAEHCDARDQREP